MLKTLERYQKCSYGAVEVNRPAKELEVRSLTILIYMLMIGMLFLISWLSRNIVAEQLPGVPEIES